MPQPRQQTDKAKETSEQEHMTPEAMLQEMQRLMDQSQLRTNEKLDKDKQEILERIEQDKKEVEKKIEEAERKFERTAQRPTPAEVAEAAAQGAAQRAEEEAKKGFKRVRKIVHWTYEHGKKELTPSVPDRGQVKAIVIAEGVTILALRFVAPVQTLALTYLIK